MNALHLDSPLQSLELIPFSDYISVCRSTFAMSHIILLFFFSLFLSKTTKFKIRCTHTHKVMTKCNAICISFFLFFCHHHKIEISKRMEGTEYDEILKWKMRKQKKKHSNNIEIRSQSECNSYICLSKWIGKMSTRRDFFFLLHFVCTLQLQMRRSRFFLLQEETKAGFIVNFFILV